MIGTADRIAATGGDFNASAQQRVRTAVVLRFPSRLRCSSAVFARVLCDAMPVSQSARNAPAKAGPKPRVLLVDDHCQVLDTVSAMLSDDFDVVGVATDGAQAVDTACKVTPDVVVLDVDMPALTGFQTLQALKHAGVPPAPAVFLSLHDSDEVVGEAFRCGGLGYVLKSRVRRDLTVALQQALRGRVFAPSLRSLFELVNGGGHAMQVHRGAEPFLDGLADVFDLALRRG